MRQRLVPDDEIAGVGSNRRRLQQPQRRLPGIYAARQRVQPIAYLPSSLLFCASMAQQSGSSKHTPFLLTHACNICNE
jgi:hypothetical protein